MNKRILKRTLLIVIFAFAMWLFTNHVDAAYISISLNKTTASAGETISGTISSDCIGRVNLSSSNGTLSTDRVWIEGGSQSFTVTVGSSGSTAITATAENGKMSNAGTDVEVSPAGASISIGASSTGSSTPSSSTNAGTTTNGSTPRASTTSEESSNANLSNLGIRPNDFTGFTPGTTTYNVTVPEDVESVEVYATAQDSGATISGTGTKTLQNGANALNVVVTAEDGTTKTYTINVTREGEEETEEQPEENTEEVKNGLSNISIANLELSPSFDTNVYEYTVKYVGEDTSLDIQAVATDPNYTVEVLGNEELKEGENIITILVSDSEGNNVATYQVTVNKTLVDEEALAREEEEKQKEEQRKMFMIAGGVIAIIVIIVIVIIVKRRRNRAYAEDFSGVPFAGMNDDDDYYNDYGNNSNYYEDYNNIKVNNDLAEENQRNEEDKVNLNMSENQDNVKSFDDENSTNDIRPQGENLNKRIDNSKEIEEKERAKREFLKGYDSMDDDYFEEEKTRRGRKKGKRFK